MPATDAESFITAWEKVRDYPRTQPGYIDTMLHQSLTSDAEFQFVNVAHWQTVDDFTAATRSPGFRAAAAGLSGYRSHPALYRPART